MKAGTGIVSSARSCDAHRRAGKLNGAVQENA